MTSSALAKNSEDPSRDVSGALLKDQAAPQVRIADAQLDVWLTATGAGDEVAFAELFTSLWNSVFRVVYRVLRDRALAVDVVEDVMVEVWRKAPEFDQSQESSRGWVYGIGHRLAVERLQALVNAGLPFNSSSASFALATEFAERLRAEPGIRAAVAQLTPAQQEALSVIFNEGLTYSLAAESLGVPASTLMPRVRGALIYIRLAVDQARALVRDASPHVIT